jgi:hypothetical protein
MVLWYNAVVYVRQTKYMDKHSVCIIAYEIVLCIPHLQVRNGSKKQGIFAADTAIFALFLYFTSYVDVSLFRI